MLPKPGICAIDDEQDHLDAIADALNSSGSACLKLLFRGGISPPQPLAYVRVLFVDLHLSQPGFSDDRQHFAVIGSLLQEHLSPKNGPFLLLLWTQSPDTVEALGVYLNDRLQDTPYAIPVRVDALSKGDHLRDNRVASSVALLQEISASIARVPQVAALFDWERRMASAAADTIAAVLSLVPANKRGPGDLGGELERLLGGLATAAVGKSNVSQNRRGAVNEALVPILYDRASQVVLDAVAEQCWAQAIPDPSRSVLTESQTSQLNCMLHLDLDTTAFAKDDRGVVLELPSRLTEERAFESQFGMKPDRAATKQFGLAAGVNANEFKWIVLQTEAVCDHAQAQPGPTPFVLGIESPVPKFSNNKPPQAVWQSPVLQIDGVPKRIAVNFRFAQSWTLNNLTDFTARYRFRESLANDALTRLHSYGARPGIISLS